MDKRGIVRPMDQLGRVVLPMEWRKRHNVNPGDLLEIFFEGDSVRLQKIESTCAFCDSSDGLTTFKGKSICRKCLDEMKSK